MSNDSSSAKPWWRLAIPKKDWGIVIGALVAGIAMLGPWFLLEPLAPLIGRLPLDRNAKIAILTAVATALSVLVIAAALAVYKKTFRDIGFDKPKLLYAAKAFVGFIVYFFVSVILQTIGRNFFNLNTDEAQELGYQGLDGIGLLLAFVPLVVLTPIAEETIFRGFLFTGFRRHLPFWITAIGVSALFGLAHGQWNVGLDVFAMSLISCYLVETTKSLWPSIFLHTIKNGLAFYLIYLYNGS